MSNPKEELESLRSRVHELELELSSQKATDWGKPEGYYGTYHATTGFMLGFFGAITSLIVNVIGAPIAGKHPLELIRVYLTFPLGEKVLGITGQSGSAENFYVIGDGVVIACGCCLYVATGMILGIPFQMFLAKFAANGSLVKRLILASILALAIWIFNFYVILSWLQPLLFGGNWIVNQEYLPWWVAAGTHLVFGWTMALVYPLGQYVHYQRPTEQ